MATYAIGDVQGRFDALTRLLERMRFDAAADRLWFVGDLVNRGPASLDVLRFVRALGERATVVLGNHDLHLLAVAAGARRVRPDDTLDDILAAPDRAGLLAWLRGCRLFHRDPAMGFSMVHAGVPPQWDLATLERCAAEVERVLQGANGDAFLGRMYGDRPDRWDEALVTWRRWRFITNALTRLRYCTADGRLVLREKRPPGTQDPACLPWFEAPGRKTAGERLIFGHWAALGPDPARARQHRVHHLDTGCVWGGDLTALRLEDERYFSVPCGRSGSKTDFRHGS